MLLMSKSYVHYNKDCDRKYSFYEFFHCRVEELRPLQQGLRHSPSGFDTENIASNDRRATSITTRIATLVIVIRFMTILHLLVEELRPLQQGLRHQ